VSSAIAATGRTIGGVLLRFAIAALAAIAAGLVCYLIVLALLWILA
jgi:hypothetical protein